MLLMLHCTSLSYYPSVIYKLTISVVHKDNILLMVAKKMKRIIQLRRESIHFYLTILASKYCKIFFMYKIKN